MKKVLIVFTGAIFYFLLSSVCQIYAEEGVSSSANWKDERSSGRQQAKVERQEIKQNAQGARAEEKAIRQQIREAMGAGNTERAAQLKEQLKSVHQKNTQEMIQNKARVGEARKELQQDKKARRDSLTPEQRKKMKERRKDLDNNPPGPKGGPGVSPDRNPQGKGPVSGGSRKR